MEWKPAPDIQKRIEYLIKKLNFQYIDPSSIHSFRSNGSVARANARIWGLPKIWQLALKCKPYYIIEVISHYFDRMTKEDKDKVLIHELMHIPKTFSGALLSHKNRGGRIDRRTVDKIYNQLIKL